MNQVYYDTNYMLYVLPQQKSKKSSYYGTINIYQNVPLVISKSAIWT